MKKEREERVKKTRQRRRERERDRERRRRNWKDGNANGEEGGGGGGGGRMGLVILGRKKFLWGGPSTSTRRERVEFLDPFRLTRKTALRN